MSKKCLFSAPHSFLADIKENFNSILPTEFKEIWNFSEIKYSKNIIVWVVNPGQKFVINDEILNFFPNLELIITPSTGKNHIDEDECLKKNIKVFGLLDARDILSSITASSEFTFLLILNALRKLDFAVLEVSEGRWRDNEDLLRGYELNGRKIGIVGLGRIGSNIARWTTEFGAEVYYYDPYKNNKLYNRKKIKEIFSDSDIICISCILNKETKGLINYELLSNMKKNAVFINTSRGEIVNEKDLSRVLNQRIDIHACVDVLSGEVKGQQHDSPLMRLQKKGRITITPHIAGATFDSQIKAANGALELFRKNFIKL